ncbi:MAG: malto-oligosyltrehalose trehalohydrolase [Sulfolobus sp.]
MVYGTELIPEKNTVSFKIWAPYINELEIKIHNKGIFKAEKDERGYFYTEIKNVKEGELYTLLLNGKEEIPDPTSKSQPLGVHGPSQIINLNFEISELGKVNLKDLIIYELHVGTFTQKGNFYGVIEKLDYLKELGVNAIELMPISQFPGRKDWGYDGVFLYAVQSTYGGAKGLAKLVDEAHKREIAVILDVVYNHIGPEGNYLAKLGPYFSQKYKTPWGLTFNFDDYGSDEVRKFILENVRYWFEVFKIDGLRLDAVHAIFDMSPKHILEEISELAHSLGKFVIAESDLNDPKIVREDCGYKIDAQWVDDFHHSIHAYVTKEKSGYYIDYGSLSDIEKAFKDIFVYDGRYSKFRGKTHGAKVGNISRSKFVVYIQNHDQVGNRGNGERLSQLVDKTTYLISATLYLLSPYIPMIFMGEEYFERKPFLFFSDFSDENLIKGVREGRLKENGQTIDPQSDDAYNLSKLSWQIDVEVFDYYKKLIKIRKEYNISGKIPITKIFNSSIIIQYDKISLVTSFSDDFINIDFNGKLILGINFPNLIRKGENIKTKKGVGVYELC